MNKLQNFLKPVAADLFAGRSDEPGQRLGERVKAIGLDQVAKCQLALIGFPEYAGIARNGGRLGVDSDVTEALAKLRQNHGPASVRKRLYSMTTGSLGMVLGAGMAIADLGDFIIDNDDVDLAIANFTKVLEEVYKAGVIPLIIGGGHHTSIASIGAWLKQNSSHNLYTSVVDAHCDFRDYKNGVIHSGMPFRYLTDHYDNFKLRHLTEIGLRPERNPGAYIEELQKAGAKLWSIDECTTAPSKPMLPSGNPAFLSIDIDAFAVNGASASYPGGLPLTFGRALARQFGRHQGTIGVDVLEVNPHLGPESSEAAAQLLWAFMVGFGERRIVGK
jgi:formiminoglutamase